MLCRREGTKLITTPSRGPVQGFRLGGYLDILSWSWSELYVSSPLVQPTLPLSTIVYWLISSMSPYLYRRRIIGSRELFRYLSSPDRTQEISRHLLDFTFSCVIFESIYRQEAYHNTAWSGQLEHPRLVGRLQHCRHPCLESWSPPPTSSTNLGLTQLYLSIRTHDKSSIERFAYIDFSSNLRISRWI